ncbi:hypothetical protein Bca101_086635 [Brassica carinata]
MDVGEITPFPIFYKLKDVPRLAQSVKQLKGCFRNRLLKIEQEVRKTVNRDNVNSILDTEARIWEWRRAISSISSRPGLSNENSSDPVFFTDVVTKGFGLNHPGISRFEEPSRVLEIESSQPQQRFDNVLSSHLKITNIT